MAQTQAQRKKALTEAQERLRLAENAYDEALRDFTRNEPLTEGMEACLLAINQNGTGINVVFTAINREFWIHPTSGRESIEEEVFEGLLSRGLIFDYRIAGTDKLYVLSDWGKQVAEALAKAEGS